MWEKKIHYEKLEIADYLMPYNSKLSIEDKRKLLSIRNRMTEIGNNFGQKENCVSCQKNENMEHVYIHANFWINKKMKFHMKEFTMVI